MKNLDINAHPARISREPGGELSLFGDYIIGRQIELVPARHLAAGWHSNYWDPLRKILG